MSDRLDPWLAALIRQERARRGPPPAVKAQVLERIRTSLPLSKRTMKLLRPATYDNFGFTNDARD